MMRETLDPSKGQVCRAKAVVGAVGGLGLYGAIVRSNLGRVVGSFWSKWFTPVECRCPPNIEKEVREGSALTSDVWMTNMPEHRGTGWIGLELGAMASFPFPFFIGGGSKDSDFLLF